VVVDAEAKKTKEDTPGSERRSVLKKSLTGPTLLEMSGNPTNQKLDNPHLPRRVNTGLKTSRFLGAALFTVS
jgi:hypothetical protein